MLDPTLAENDDVDAVLDVEFDVALEETDDEKELVRGRPAIVVAFTAGLTSLELGGAAGLLLIGSPALSANVFRFGGGSGREDK